MTSNAHVYFMSSHPINIATIKVVSGGKICSPHIAQCTHELATSHLIYMLRHHNQDVDFRFGRKPRNGGATILKFLCDSCVGRRVSKVPTDCDFEGASWPDAYGPSPLKLKCPRAMSNLETKKTAGLRAFSWIHRVHQHQRRPEIVSIDLHLMSSTCHMETRKPGKLSICFRENKFFSVNALSPGFPRGADLEIFRLYCLRDQQLACVQEVWPSA